MSTVTSAVTTCPPLQAMLQDMFFSCASMGPDPIAILPFLNSPENRTAIRYAVSPVPGKKREVLVVYDQLIDDSEVDTKEGCDKTCTATTERGDLSATYSIDCGGYIIESLIDPTTWINSCTSTYDVAMREIMKMIGAMDNKISKATVTDLGSLLGAYASEITTTGDVLVVNTLQPSSTAFNGGAMYDIDFALQSTYCGPAFIGVGQTLKKYYAMMEAGCCSNDGINLGDLFNTYRRAVAYDVHFQQTYGSDMGIAMQAGAVQLLTLNHNMGQLTDLSYINVGPGAGTYAELIVISPWTGLPYDLTVKYDCSKVHLILEANVQAVGMPLDMFPSGNRRDGVTFVNMIDVSNT